jgi:hypothetical protein
MPTCGAPLVLLDSIEHPSGSESEIWFDEWLCPQCRDGIVMDWPASEWAALAAEDERE